MSGRLASWGKQFERVHEVGHALLENYTPDGYAIALRQLVEKQKPYLTIFPHTYQVRDFAPKLATSLGRVLVSDAVGHRVENGRLTLVRQLFQGKINSDVQFVGEPPYFASMQAGAYRADLAENGSAPVEAFAPAADIRTSRSICSGIAARGRSHRRHHRFGRPGDQRGGEYSHRGEAGCGVGRGAGGVASDLRQRMVSDGRQVGSSGKRSHRRCMSRSGSSRDSAPGGDEQSKIIVAINRIRRRPIFEVADYGIVGDLFQVVPALVDAITKPRVGFLWC